MTKSPNDYIQLKNAMEGITSFTKTESSGLASNVVEDSEKSDTQINPEEPVRYGFEDYLSLIHDNSQSMSEDDWVGFTAMISAKLEEQLRMRLSVAADATSVDSLMGCICHAERSRSISCYA